jgi:hypothetical protein
VLLAFEPDGWMCGWNRPPNEKGWLARHGGLLDRGRHDRIAWWSNPAHNRTFGGKRGSWGGWGASAVLLCTAAVQVSVKPRVSSRLTTGDRYYCTFGHFRALPKFPPQPAPQVEGVNSASTVNSVVLSIGLLPKSRP